MKTTTTNKKKIEHRAIIAKWQEENAMKCAVNLLKRIANDTCDNKVIEMYNGLCADQKKIGNVELLHGTDAVKAYTVSDGYDIYLECLCYLREMNKKGYWQLFKAETIEITMSKGKKKKVSLWQGMRYYARHYIYKYGQADFKTVYIEDLSGEDKDGNELNCYDALDGLMKVTQYYDIENERDYAVFKTFLDSIRNELTPRRKMILHYKLKGMSVNEIAENMGVKQNTISEHLTAIQEVVKGKYPELVRGFKEKRERKKA